MLSLVCTFQVVTPGLWPIQNKRKVGTTQVNLERKRTHAIIKENGRGLWQEIIVANSILDEPWEVNLHPTLDNDDNTESVHRCARYSFSSPILIGSLKCASLFPLDISLCLRTAYCIHGLFSMLGHIDCKYTCLLGYESS